MPDKQRSADDVANSIFDLLGIAVKRATRTGVRGTFAGAGGGGGSGAGRGLINPFTAEGQMVISNVYNQAAALDHPGSKGWILVTTGPTQIGWLAPGLAGQVLTMISGMPRWAYAISELGDEPDYTVVVGGAPVGSQGAWVVSTP